MSRLTTRARVALALLLPVWIIGFGLSIAQYARGRLSYAYVQVEASDSPGGHPLVRGVETARIAADPGLLPGDVLLRAGDVDLGGTGPASFRAIAAEQAGPDPRVPLVFERAGKRRETELDVSYRNRSRNVAALLLSACFALVGVAVLLRAPRDWRSLLVFCLFLTYAINNLNFMGESRLLTYTWLAVRSASNLFIPFAILLALRWVGRPLSRWERVLPWLFLIKVPIRVEFALGAVLPWERASELFLLSEFAWIALFLALAIRAYSEGDALTRRQTRWVIYGLLVGLGPVLVTSLAAALDPGLAAARDWSRVTVAAVPFSFLVAIVRYDLFDIDQLIGATASYSAVGVLLLTALFAVVPGAAQAASDALGASAATCQLVLSVALAGIAVPAQGALRRRVDHLFFRQRGQLREGFEGLIEELALSTGAEDMTALAGERIDALLRPESCVVYAEIEGVCTPVFARGRAVPPVLEAESPLVATLRARPGPLVAGPSSKRNDDASFSAFDRAALETLAAIVVVPIRRGPDLFGFLCLGPKRSGDIYTPMEIVLLERVAEKVSAQLLRFDDAEIIRQGRAMQQALRRYVPGAVAEEIESGEDLEAGEREVSVLFVDLRGYTTLSESRRAEAVFSTVNRYTELVSGIVRQHGGSIVEFHGDGLMAVFGAPRPMPEKERAAVEAGREIAARVPSLPVDDPELGNSTLSAGVGIATGPAYVGNIQAVDRMIWSAIGSTTNLAARLEALTREREAWMVIDAVTWRRAAKAVWGFEEVKEVRIRGETVARDLYVLPIVKS